MTEALVNGYSSERTQRELSNEYKQARVSMIFKNLCTLVLKMEVASALEGVNLISEHKMAPHAKCSGQCSTKFRLTDQSDPVSCFHASYKFSLYILCFSPSTRAGKHIAVERLHQGLKNYVLIPGHLLLYIILRHLSELYTGVRLVRHTRSSEINHGFRD